MSNTQERADVANKDTEPKKEAKPEGSKWPQRLLIGHTFQGIFYMLYQVPLCWMFFNVLCPGLCVWEYGICVRGILNKIGLGYLREENWKQHGKARIEDWRHISQQLIDRVSVRYLSVALFAWFHITFLTMRSRNICTCLVMMYIFILFYKIYVFNSYMNELATLAKEYKKNPEATQEAYDKMMLAQQQSCNVLRDPDSQQGLDKGTVGNKDDNSPIVVADKISDLGTLEELLEDNDFQTHMLIITCLSMLLEIFGQVFISLATCSGYWLYFIDKRFLFYMVHCSQLADVGGLVFGKFLGRTPFMQRISPKKTMEGLFGCIFFSVLTSVVFYYCGTTWAPDNIWAVKLPLIDYLTLGFINGLLACLGDLIESFLKRCANVKDSSNLLGAHGGFFDRLDSMLLVGPFMLWYALQYQKFHNQPDYSFDKVHIFEFLQFDTRWQSPEQLIMPIGGAGNF